MLNRGHVNNFFIHFIILVSTVVVLQSPLKAQSDLKREELKGLQKQLDDLKEAQRAIQKDLQEIKAILQGRLGDPSLPAVNLTLRISDKPFKGDKNAMLTLVEFSDYQCPFCARHFRETLPQIEKEFINTGKIKYILRDFPLEAIHNDAFKAAEAVNCAGEQGKYWQMHDQLFQNQNQLGLPALPTHARAIGLKAAEFEECLKSGRQGTEIRKDMEDGQRSGVQGTPAFFLGFQEPDGKTIKVLKAIMGAQPYAQFKAAIDQVLNQEKR